MNIEVDATYYHRCKLDRTAKVLAIADGGVMYRRTSDDYPPSSLLIATTTEDFIRDYSSKRGAPALQFALRPWESGIAMDVGGKWRIFRGTPVQLTNGTWMHSAGSCRIPGCYSPDPSYCTSPSESWYTKEELDKARKDAGLC